MFSTVIDAAYHCVSKIGEAKTLELLQGAQFNVDISDERVLKVLDSVSEITNIPIHEILFGSGRKNERKYAIGFCAHYLHSPEYYNMDMEQVKDFLCKNDVVICYKYAKLIGKISPTHISDKQMHEWKKQLDTKLFIKKTK